METIEKTVTHRIPVLRIEVVKEKNVNYETPSVVRSANDVVVIVREMLNGLDREKLICVHLNARHVPIACEVVSVGSLTASIAHPREIFKSAIVNGAAGIVLAHNHPSGDPSPSDEDVRLTERISKAARILGIDLLDHLIVGEEGAYSFKTSGRLS